MLNPQRSQLKQDILELLKNSDNVLCDFSNQIKDKVLVVFVGNTRSGKSTLVNYIAGVPLAGVQQGDTFKIECLERSVTIIGHGSLSRTTIPTVIEFPRHVNYLVVDAPGFDDNRGARQDIFNALYINQIKHAKGVKFVLVSDIIDILTDNVNNFLYFMETVKNIMPNIEKLQDAVSIVFTKVSDEHNPQKIAALLRRKILSVEGLRCQTDLIKHFVDNPDIIGVFKMPRNAGLIDYDLGENIENAIFRHEPVNLSEYDIKFGISTASMVVLLEAYLDFFDVRMYVTDVTMHFIESITAKFACLTKEKLLLLTEEQLTGDNNVLHVVKQYRSKVKSALQVSMISDISNILSDLFIIEIQKVSTSLQCIQVEFESANEPHLNAKIEEVCRQLEYLTCVEKVVDNTIQSESIIHSFKNPIDLFQKDLEILCMNIKREIELRKRLHECTKIIPDILPLLEKVDAPYLQASTKDELQVMKAEASRYRNLIIIITHDIKCRPSISQYIDQEIVNMVITKIDSKLEEIEHFLSLPYHALPNTTTLVGGGVLLPAITAIVRNGGPNYAAMSFLGLVFLCFKSKFWRTIIRTTQDRWIQNRLLRSNTILDGCCNNLIANFE